MPYVSLVGTVNEIRHLLPRANTGQEGQAVVAGRRALKDGMVKAEPPSLHLVWVQHGVIVSELILTALKNQKRTLG